LKRFATFEKVCLAYTRRTREESVGDNTPGTPREVPPVSDFFFAFGYAGKVNDNRRDAGKVSDNRRGFAKVDNGFG
jgi:hypothetical protein